MRADEPGIYSDLRATGIRRTVAVAAAAAAATIGRTSWALSFLGVQGTRLWGLRPCGLALSILSVEPLAVHQPLHGCGH